MDLMKDLSGLLQQYQGAEPGQAPDTVDDDFDQVAQAAPQPALADGLAAAFRSEQTPEFGQMTANLFNNSNPQQQAGLLNTILKYVGPAILGRVMSGGDGGGGTSSTGGGGGLSDLINIFKGGGQQEVTPEQAGQIPPEAVQQVAEEAQKHDPSIIERISEFYAEHPTLVKTLGTAALTIALSKIANRQFK
ncbi:MAG: hypothetical protein QOH25_285 [Acidobacteriota bacterium]|jgi:hypothetical protein|nr:hypothetical protein [Acidobacteriota bacterium]